jgi:hypothetical protein
LQNCAAAQESNFHHRSRSDLSLFKVRIDAVRVAVDWDQGRLALHDVITRFHVQVGNEAAHGSPYLCSLEIECGKVTGRDRLLVARGGPARIDVALSPSPLRVADEDVVYNLHECMQAVPLSSGSNVSEAASQSNRAYPDCRSTSVFQPQ